MLTILVLLTMPLSIDEATKRYESYCQNMQDAIFTMESYMGRVTSFSFNLPQVLGNLDNVDTTTEERNISSYVSALEEYRKIIILERKRRAIHEIIDGKMKVETFKTNLKLQRRAKCLAITNPYKPPQTGKDEPTPRVEVMEQSTVDEPMPQVQLIEQ